MSEIKVGDLVVVMRPKRCGCNNSIGRIWVVKDLNSDERSGRCTECGVVTYPPVTPTAHISNGYAELWRLKRIPPLSELEGERTEEKLKEPV